MGWHTMPTIMQEDIMPTRNVVLTDHQASLVEQREAEDAYRLEALRAAVNVGVAHIEAGPIQDL
jgi:hypothetical protein